MKHTSRITTLFNTEHKANIAFIMAGDGGINHTLAAAKALIQGGVNLLEIGIPFSDPIADGPVIQRASERAIAAGTALQDVLWLVKEIRLTSDIPLVLFSYLNPLLLPAKSHFFNEAKAAGVDGLLLVDCPVEESTFIRGVCLQNKIDMIHVVTPTTPIERIKYINEFSQGFIYYACRKGTTGVRNRLPEDLACNITSIRTATDLPVVVGFGISNNAMVREVNKVADGAVVGSLFVKALEDGISLSSLRKLAEDIYAD